MTVVSARVPAGRSIDVDTFADLTDADVQVEFSDTGGMVVTLTPDVSDDVAAAVRIRMISQGPEDETLRGEIAALLAEPASAGRTDALVELLGQLAIEWA